MPRYVVEDDSQSNLSHLGTCERLTHLNQFVIVDAQCQKANIEQVPHVKWVSDDVQLKMMSRNWALDAIDIEKVRSSSLGKGINIFIQDTGVSSNSGEFGNRLKQLKSANNDPNHGTAVASMAAGTQYGLATSASIIDVQTNLTLASIMKGLDKVIDYHKKSTGHSVLNLSYGGYNLSPLFNDAIHAVASHGIIIVAAAGNDGLPYAAEPAAYDDVIAVGSHNRWNRISWFSNHGTGVDVYAPGERVRLVNGTFDGTSFSSPLVAGICAVMLQEWGEIKSIGDVLSFKHQFMKLNPTKTSELTFASHNEGWSVAGGVLGVTLLIIVIALIIYLFSRYGRTK